MATDVTLPQLGESVTEGTVTRRLAQGRGPAAPVPPGAPLPEGGSSVPEGPVPRWLKQVGDSVAVDEPLLEVSTDKVDTEIPPPVAGPPPEVKAGRDRPGRAG